VFEQALENGAKSVDDAVFDFKLALELAEAHGKYFLFYVREMAWPAGLARLAPSRQHACRGDATLPVQALTSQAMAIQFTTRLSKERRTLVAHALELGVSSCGGSKDKALQNPKESGAAHHQRVKSSARKPDQASITPV
jgi:hypothetical protein